MYRLRGRVRGLGFYRLCGFGSYGPAPAPIATVLQNASAASGVPVNILQALAYQESGYNPNAVSGKGAQGLLQIMPANDQSFGLTSPFDPQQNATAGATYLKSLYDQYGNWTEALEAYNEGPGALASQGPFASSASYASTILSNAGVSDSTDTSGAFVGPPDVFSTGDTSIDTSGAIATVNPAASAMDPMTMFGIALGAIGLIAWAAA